MSILRQWIDRPKQLWLRKAIFQVHLWIGIAIGIYLLAIGVSGSILVFEEELEELLEPKIYEVEGPTAPAASIPDLVAAAQAAYPKLEPSAIYAPTEHRHTYVVYFRTGDDVLYVYLHPRTKQVVGATLPSTSVVRWLQDFHFNLFNGRTGRSWNAIGALMLLGLCVTGLVIWWPGVQQFKNALSIRAWKNWKRLNWEIHSTVGFWTVTVLSIWAISGFYFGFSAQVMAAVNRVSPLSQVEAPESKPMPASDTLRPSFGEMLAKAERLAPNTTFYGFQFPANKRATHISFMARENPPEKGTSDYVYLDQYTGQYIKTWNRGLDRSIGDMLIHWLVPLHFGTFGGLPVKILWAVLGLVPPLMFVTGVLMWWNRVIFRKLRRSDAQPSRDSRQLSSLSR